jgi:hypothetical protein
MITDDERTSCNRLRRIYRLESALKGALPILRDFEHLTGFGETHAAIVSSISLAETALANHTCENCEYFHECEN